MHHPFLAFLACSKDELVGRASGMLGSVLLCNASAKHSFVEEDGSAQKPCVTGSSAEFLVVLKDDEGKSLTQGGNVVEAVVSQAPSAASAQTASLQVVDNSNGTHTIRFIAHQAGRYTVHVTINNAKLARPLSITSLEAKPLPPVAIVFDSNECQRHLEISSDRRTITRIYRWHGLCSSVLCSEGAQPGEHSWSVQIAIRRMCIYVGVAVKDHLTSERSNFDSAYCWAGGFGSGSKIVMGNWSKSKAASERQSNNILHLQFDGDQSILSLTNKRTQRTDTIRGLPTAKLFLFTALACKGDRLTILEPK